MQIKKKGSTESGNSPPSMEIDRDAGRLMKFCCFLKVIPCIYQGFWVPPANINGNRSRLEFIGEASDLVLGRLGGKFEAKFI
jgi:hypothetical protein